MYPPSRVRVTRSVRIRTRKTLRSLRSNGKIRPEGVNFTTTGNLPKKYVFERRDGLPPTISTNQLPMTTDKESVISALYSDLETVSNTLFMHLI